MQYEYYNRELVYGLYHCCFYMNSEMCTYVKLVVASLQLIILTMTIF